MGRRTAWSIAAVATGTLVAGLLLWERERNDEPSIGSSSIVMLGDSITEQGDWAALLPDYPIVNMGRSGYTTEQLAPVAEQVAQTQPGAVFVLTGTNDLRDDHPPEWTADQLGKLLDALAVSETTTVIVQTIMPRADRPAEAAAIAEAIRGVANERGLRVLDLHPEFDNGDGGMRASETTDGVHLSPEGYERWVAALRPVLDDLTD